MISAITGCRPEMAMDALEAAGQDERVALLLERLS
jgi:hypothetical protein